MKSALKLLLLSFALSSSVQAWDEVGNDWEEWEEYLEQHPSINQFAEGENGFSGRFGCTCDFSGKPWEQIFPAIGNGGTRDCFNARSPACGEARQCLVTIVAGGSVRTEKRDCIQE